MIIAENGTPKCNDNGWACSNTDIYNMFKKYLNNAKECGSSKGCMMNYKGTDGANLNFDTRSDLRKLILSDGTLIGFEYKDADCLDRNFNPPKEGRCAFIWVDVNGAKKPNKRDEDLFQLVLDDARLRPGDAAAELIMGNGTK